MTTSSAVAAILIALTRLITGIRAHWVGTCPSADRRVYFANHSSHLDALTIWASLPPEVRHRTRPVAAADYWDRPGLHGWLAREVLNAVLVDHSSSAGKRQALALLTGALDEGASLILFPEGTRGQGNTISELQSGLFFIARERPQVALVPVYLENLSRILPKGEYLPVPLLGSATFGPPLHLDPGEARTDFLQRARAALVALVAPWGSEA